MSDKFQSVTFGETELNWMLHNIKTDTDYMWTAELLSLEIFCSEEITCAVVF